MVLCEGRSKWHPEMRMVDVCSCARGATTPNLQCLALPGNRRTLACDESGVMARLGASGDQWAVPRAQSRSTEPYWEPVELEEEGVARGGVVVVVLVSREIAFSKHQLGPKLVSVDSLPIWSKLCLVKHLASGRPKADQTHQMDHTGNQDQSPREVKELPVSSLRTTVGPPVGQPDRDHLH